MGVRLSGKSFPATELASGCVAKGPLVFEDGGTEDAPAIQFEGPSEGIFSSAIGVRLVAWGAAKARATFAGFELLEALNLPAATDPEDVTSIVNIFTTGTRTVQIPANLRSIHWVVNVHASGTVTLNDSDGALVTTVGPESAVLLFDDGASGFRILGTT